MENPVFLFALPLLLLPLLLRMVRPPRPLLIRFSQMAVLEKVLMRVPTSRRSNPWWLILIRMACMATLLLLVLGLIWQGSLAGSSRIACLILIDDSYHSRTFCEDDERLWNHLRAAATRELKGLPFGSSSAWVGFSGRHNAWETPAESSQGLEHLPLLAMGEDWFTVRLKLRDFSRSRGQERMEVVLVNGGSVEKRTAMMQALGVLHGNITLRQVTVSPPLRPNADLQAGISPTRMGLGIHGTVTLPETVTRSSLKLQSLSGKTREFPIEKSGPFVWNVEDWSEAHGELRLQIQDGLDLDNQVYFADVHQQRFNLVVLDQENARQRLNDVSHYLMRALRSLEDRSALSVERRTPRHWSSFDNGHVDLVILLDPPFLSSAEADVLKRYVRRGGSLMILAGPQCRHEDLELHLGTFLPARFKEIQRTTSKVSSPEPLGLDRLNSVPLRARWLFAALGPDAETVLRFDDGAPAWISQKMEAGKVHLISSLIHLEWSDAVLLADFPQLVQTLLELSGRAWERSQGALSLEMGTPFPKGIRSIRNLLGGESHTGDRAEPGLYELTDADGVVRTQACNFPSGERMNRVAIDPLDIPSRKTALSPEGHPWRADRWIALAFILLVLAEATYLLHQRRRPAVS